MQPPIVSSRLLLYLEWVILGIAALTVILTSAVRSPEFSLWAIASIAAFGALRIWLSTGKRIHKILYTGLEFGLIVLPSLIDDRIPMVPTLAIAAVVRGCQRFQLPGCLAVTGLAFLTFLAVPFLEGQAIGVGEPMRQGLVLRQACNLVLLRILFVASSGLVIVFILLLFKTLRAERQSQEKLAAAHEQLRQYALRIEDQAILQERNRIAREIHDALGHTLTAQSIQLENALLFLQSNPGKTESFLSDAKTLGSQALQDVRQSVATLWADPLHGRSLSAAIATLINGFRATTAIAPDCIIDLSHPLSTEISIAVYRILQEALTNITKHAVATQATIYLQSNDTALHLLVEDNGRGFNPAQNTTGFGLQGMRERVLALGGDFSLISQPGMGCLITARIPLTVRIAQLETAS